MKQPEEHVIGRAERIDVIGHDTLRIPAKVDTGADISSIWASEVIEANDRLQFVLFDKRSEFFTGQVFTLNHADYRLVRVANSFGHKEDRYLVKLPVRVLGRRMSVSFTLANRSQKIYPILLGRKMLHNKFVVDVSKGEPLAKEERNKLRRMHVALSMEQD